MSSCDVLPANKYGGRITYFDIAKGISIVLIALFHTTLGFSSANIIQYSPTLSFFTTLVYSFHVHLFFVISGYLSVKALDRPNFLQSRLLALYYPYLVWSVVSVLVTAAAGDTTNHHFSLYSLLSLPVWPILHYWFMLSLMIATALLYIFRTPQALVISAIGTLIASLFLPGWLHDTAYFYPFAALGALYARNGSLPVLRQWIGGLCLLALIAGACIAFITGYSEVDVRDARFILFSVAGCYALSCFSSALAPYAVGRFFAHLGKDSLPIYLMHVLFASTLRVVLYKLDPLLNPLLGIVICFAASIGLSLLAKQIAYRAGLLKIVGLEPVQWSRSAAPLSDKPAT